MPNTAMRYPLTRTQTGDLQLNELAGNTKSENDSRRYTSRVRLLLACEPGDRPLLPEYGALIEQFAPEMPGDLTAAVVQDKIQRWVPDSSSDFVNFQVESDNKTNGRLQLAVTWAAAG